MKVSTRRPFVFDPSFFAASVAGIAFFAWALLPGVVPAAEIPELDSAAAQAASSPVFSGPLSPEQVVDLRKARSVVLSGDGARAVYVLDVARGVEEEYGPAHQEIWTVPFSGGPARPLTHAPGRTTAPALSPDGETLAFLAKRGEEEHTQIYILPLSGGEARRLTAADSSVASFSWSPDGKALAYLAVDPVSSARKEDEEKGRDWLVADALQRPRRLWRIDVANGTAQEITTDSSSVWHYAWFPDGSRLALTVSQKPDIDSSYIYKSLALVAAAGGAPRTIWDAPGKMGHPAVAPDGRHIAINAAISANDPAAGSLFLVNVKTGRAANRTPALDATVTWVGWASAHEVLLAAHQGTGSLLAAIPVDGDGAMKMLLAGTPIFTEVAVSTDGLRFVMAASTAAHPDEVFAWQRGDSPMARLTDSNPGLEDASLGEQTVVRWQAEDGLEIEGILILPVGAGDKNGPQRPYPLVSVVHGGPESCWHDGWNTSYSRWGQVLAGRGFAVLMANYRGSTGRGVPFAKANHRDLAGREFRDILDGIDALVARGLVDPQRVGSGGSSYGGYFSAWAATRYSGRFAASVVFAGITNWMSFTGTSDIPEENSVVHWDLSPYLRADLAWDRSPVAHVRTAETPTLIAHGAKDERVPLGQGKELYTALRLKGTPVEFVTYPRELHGLRERAHQLDYMNRALGWYERWLGAGAQD
ncbi:MAG: S9 family peptidase [Acidobacteria bacterium]|nr:S9 family peptidase [Acidobacteriota bacterium]